MRLQINDCTLRREAHLQMVSHVSFTTTYQKAAFRRSTRAPLKDSSPPERYLQGENLVQQRFFKARALEIACTTSE